MNVPQINGLTHAAVLATQCKIYCKDFRYGGIITKG